MTEIEELVNENAAQKAAIINLKSAFDKAIEALRFIEQDRNLNERPHLVARRVLVELGCFDLKQTPKED